LLELATADCASLLGLFLVGTVGALVVEDRAFLGLVLVGTVGAAGLGGLNLLVEAFGAFSAKLPAACVQIPDVACVELPATFPASV
jgi:hypothetical protein